MQPLDNLQVSVIAGCVHRCTTALVFAIHARSRTERRRRDGCGAGTRKSAARDQDRRSERERAVAPPMAAESRLRRTVRGPGTPAADATPVSVAARRLARCHQPPERL